MENNYFALLANDVKKLWNGLDDGQKLGMLALIVVTIIAATFFLSKAMEPDWVVLYSDLNEVNTLTIVENMKKNGVQTRISQFGCTEADLETLTQGVVNVSFSADGTLASIPPITRDEAYEIYKLSL